MRPELLHPVDHREHLVDLVHVGLALQQVGHPLLAQAGVDVLGRQLAEDRVPLLARPVTADVLHEHEVPELHVPVAGLPVAVGAKRGAAVDQDLAARPARARNAHRPVVVLHPEPDDPVVGQAGDLLPQGDRLVVLVVDRGVEVLLGEAEAAVGDRPGGELPGQLDGAFLEVVAEAEVAVHLEERAVARGLTDLLDVEGAHALLHAGGARVGRGLLPEEVRLERHHAGVDEQQRGVVVEQRSTGDDGVPTLLEEAQPAAADLGGLHGATLPGRWGGSANGFPAPRGGRQRWIAVGPTTAIHRCSPGWAAQRVNLGVAPARSATAPCPAPRHRDHAVIPTGS